MRVSIDLARRALPVRGKGRAHLLNGTTKTTNLLSA
jgi:hypothetical protein